VRLPKVGDRAEIWLVAGGKQSYLHGHSALLARVLVIQSRATARSASPGRSHPNYNRQLPK
jgi:hypothetical protein